MVDLIVPASTVLKIDQASQVAPRFGLFHMDANAKIVAAIDLTIKASRAEFAAGCVIDASGAPGANGVNGTGGPVGANGGSGTNGLPGQNGRNVTIEAGLAKVGGLAIITDGGAGGRGGAGGPGGRGQTQPFGMDRIPGAGGNGGSGAAGGDAGQISLVWTRLAAHLPHVPNSPPPGHLYRSNVRPRRKRWGGRSNDRITSASARAIEGKPRRSGAFWGHMHVLDRSPRLHNLPKGATAERPFSKLPPFDRDAYLTSCGCVLGIPIVSVAGRHANSSLHTHVHRRGARAAARF
jgi:hypothetical protein